VSLPLAYREEVPGEINQAVAWYEQQRPGRGREFFSALREHLDFIASNPELYAVEYRRTRPAPMRSFPYVVYYRLESARITVVAVQHGSRDPRAWRQRV
jgi:toxin ParE1/3/4